jgi:hypothetical protein
MTGHSATPRALTDEEKRALRPYIPQPDLECARILEGCVPRYLPRRYIGIARGNRIYFRQGAYAAGTAKGLALLGHELVHVGQYRRGATWLSFLLSYARHGYRNSPLELAARETQQRIASDLDALNGCRADPMAALQDAAAADR